MCILIAKPLQKKGKKLSRKIKIIGAGFNAVSIAITSQIYALSVLYAALGKGSASVLLLGGLCAVLMYIASMICLIADIPKNEKLYLTCIILSIISAGIMIGAPMLRRPFFLFFGMDVILLAFLIIVPARDGERRLR